MDEQRLGEEEWEIVSRSRRASTPLERNMAVWGRQQLPTTACHTANPL